ncbi:hypothetical protein G9A89_010404 [Geosiphon pyriformis]|nr:hypothetical protein G9A89_010404 [Geosiphon pyriformis]
MDEILTKLALHTATFVGKAAFAYSTNYAMRQVTNYIKYDSTTRKSDTTELERVKTSLDANIRIVQPSIDLIEIISARGNTFIEPAVSQAVQLRKEIDAFGHMLTIEPHELSESMSGPSTVQPNIDHARVLKDMKALNEKIREFVPYLNLVLTTSGANLGVSLRNHVSPSLLLQASSALNEAHRKFIVERHHRVRVGPLFKLKLYYLFAGNFRPKSVGDFTWKEEFTKCDGEIVRIRQTNSDEKKQFVYELILTEDLNDGRYHEEFDLGDDKKKRETSAKLESSEKIPGKVRRIPVFEISRLFYNSSGSMLNIEDSRTPVLVLKVVKGSYKGEFMRNPSQDGTNNREEFAEHNMKELYIPPVAVTPDKRALELSDTPHVECFGLELFQDAEFYFDEEDADNDSDSVGNEDSVDDQDIDFTLKRLPLSDHESSSENTISDDGDFKEDIQESQAISGGVEGIPTIGKDYLTKLEDSETYRNTLNTLSFLEYVIRLSALETSEQKQHTEISDEKINLFLKDDNSSSSSAAAAAANATSPTESSTSTDSPMGKSSNTSRVSSAKYRSPIVDRSFKTTSNITPVKTKTSTPLSTAISLAIDRSLSPSTSPLPKLRSLVTPLKSLDPSQIPPNTASEKSGYLLVEEIGNLKIDDGDDLGNLEVKS